jgi:transcriptional regulator
MSDAKSRQPLPQGSLDMLVLRTLAPGPLHGYAIARHLHEVSDAFIQVEEGSLYPALHRLEKKGWLQSQWGPSEANRKAKFYRLTPAGRKQLQIEISAWQRMQAAIQNVMNYRPSET